MPLVTLTESQMAVAVKETERRVEIGGTPYFNQDRMTPEYQYQIDFLGVKSELAVSLFLNLPWTGRAYDMSPSDVSGYEVRSTQRKDGKPYYLYVRKQDKDAIYIYCVVDGPQVVIAGWATSADVRTKGTLMYEDTQCYGLPREQLYTMDTLR